MLLTVSGYSATMPTAVFETLPVSPPATVELYCSVHRMRSLEVKCDLLWRSVAVL
jgi:hypothetical protein